jgi:hypothetical protein
MQLFLILMSKGTECDGPSTSGHTELNSLSNQGNAGFIVTGSDGNFLKGGLSRNFAPVR